MSQSTGFPPIANTNARLLILGSMPGQKSLEETQYYAHPRNAFWPIICELLNSETELSYIKRKHLLIDNKIALWDVLKSCYREGSLDSNIDHSTTEPNDFKTFLARHRHIKVIFFNGGEAEKLFKRYVMKGLERKDIEYHRLPSTSPAHAAMTKEQKLAEWNKIKPFIV